MKKLISIMMALALCLSFSVYAFAEEEAEVNDEKKIAVEDVLNQAADAIDGLSTGDTEAVKDATDSLNESLKGITSSEDFQAFKDTLIDYANKAGVDLSDIDLGVLTDLGEKFSSDSGFDNEAIVKDLMDESTPLGSLASKIIKTYYDSPAPSTTTEPTPEEEPAEVPNPPTGDSATGVIAALSVLAVSAAAFVVCTKKKED